MDKQYRRIVPLMSLVMISSTSMCDCMILVAICDFMVSVTDDFVISELICVISLK